MRTTKFQVCYWDSYLNHFEVLEEFDKYEHAEDFVLDCKVPKPLYIQKVFKIIKNG